VNLKPRRVEIRQPLIHRRASCCAFPDPMENRACTAMRRPSFPAMNSERVCVLPPTRALPSARRGDRRSRPARGDAPFVLLVRIGSSGITAASFSCSNIQRSATAAVRNHRPFDVAPASGRARPGTTMAGEEIVRERRIHDAGDGGYQPWLVAVESTLRAQRTSTSPAARTSLGRPCPRQVCT